jgi:superkiller protein 3
VRKAFNVVLGTGLVHFNPPKHHLRALGILDVVLEADKDNIVALMGRGYVMQSAKRWEDARELFGRVAALRPDDLAEGIRAKEEEAWAEVHLENLDIAEGALRSILETLDGTEERGEDKARCSYRLGRCLWARGGSFIGLCDIWLLTSFHRRQLRRGFQMLHHCSQACSHLCTGLYFSGSVLC